MHTSLTPRAAPGMRDPSQADGEVEQEDEADTAALMADEEAHGFLGTPSDQIERWWKLLE